MGHIYFHSPCFDGIVSAVVAWDVLKLRFGWTEVDLEPVGYDVRGHWVETRLPQPCAIVDFLYHPDAEFFADHHPSTFLLPAWRKEFERRGGDSMIFDPTADSCAGLLWRRFGAFLKERGLDRSELVGWAERIDAARYESPEEALSPKLPALQLAMALAAPHEAPRPEDLVKALRKEPIERVAQRASVRNAFEEVQRLSAAGLELLGRSARMRNGGIVVFDVDVDPTLAFVSRYAPYKIAPQARYSAGIIRRNDEAKITVMRNPWLEFPSVPLGQICERHGGGGHQRIGAIELRGHQVDEAEHVLGEIVAEINRSETTSSASAA